MVSSCHGPQAGFTNIKDEEEPLIRAELKNNITAANEVHTGKLFQAKIASKEQISEFLAASQIYDSKKSRWRRIPAKPTAERTLYGPFHDILCSIVNHFYHSNDRAVLDTHGMYVPHVEGADGCESKVKSSPDVMILGQGPNFDLHEPITAIKASWKNSTAKSSRKANGLDESKATDTDSWKRLRLLYRHCVSTADIKMDKDHRFMDNLVQVSVYSRQCFIQQHNRKFVYSLIITEKKAQLYQFDRAGVFHTTWINIHKDACDFVRLILGVSSLDCEVLGFDTSIFWKSGQRYIRTLDGSGNMIAYPISGRYPMFYRRAIRGRGTTCWNAKCPDGTELLIKDAWRSKDRSPEWALLKKVKGLDGVGQMIAYEEGPCISILRGFGMDEIAADGSFRDRTFCRIVLQGYGKSIQHFESREQLLYAFRDAIAGHRNLWNHNILHRDISVNNLLLGRKGAGIGNRGIVIDLDMAKLLDAETSLAGVDFRTGTQAFQSVAVLKSAVPGRNNLPHDHLDDLESFYYVLCWICLGYSAPGKPIDPRPTTLLKWEQVDPDRAADSKMAFLFVELIDNIAPYFGPIFQKLLSDIQAFFDPIIRSKLRRAHGPTPKLVDLIPAAVRHYDTILGIFDQAIQALEEENALVPPVTPTMASNGPVIASPQSGSSLKRRADNDLDNGSPTVKRPRRSGLRARNGRSAGTMESVNEGEET